MSLAQLVRADTLPDVVRYVQRTVEHINILNTDLAVNVQEDYGAAGNGTTDDTAAIQNAVDAMEDAGGGVVWLPVGTYKITGSITLRSHVSLWGAGGGILSGVSAGQITGTVILPVHGATHYPAFINDQTVNIHNFAVKDLSIDFSTDTSDATSSEAEDIGFKFFGSYSADTYLLENIIIKYAYCAFYDVSGGWLSTINRVWSRKCKYGFWKENGTTTDFENCFAEGNDDSSIDGKGWYLVSTVGCSITGCAMDNYHAQICAHFVTNYGLTINGWDSEGCETTTDFGRIFFFDSNQGLVVNGLKTMNTELHTEAAKEAYLIQVRAQTGTSCSGSFNGLDIGSNGDTCDGAGTDVYTFVAGTDDYQYLFISGSRIATVAGGGSLTGARYAMGCTAADPSSVDLAGVNLDTTNGGTASNDTTDNLHVLSESSGTPTFAGLYSTDHIIMNNAIALKGKDTGGTARALAMVTAGDDISIAVGVCRDILIGGNQTRNIVLGSLAGVLKGTAGVITGGATLDDIAEGTTYKRLTATKDTWLGQDVRTTAAPTFGNLHLDGNLVMDETGIYLADNHGIAWYDNGHSAYMAQLFLDDNAYFWVGGGGTQPSHRLYLYIEGTPYRLGISGASSPYTVTATSV